MIAYRLLMLLGVVGLALIVLLAGLLVLIGLGPMFLAARLARPAGPRAELAAGAYGLVLGAALVILFIYA